jgi:hypothetical protein
MRNPGNWSNFELLAPTVAVGPFAVLAAVVIAATALTVAPRQAEATAQMAQQTNLPCRLTAGDRAAHLGGIALGCTPTVVSPIGSAVRSLGSRAWLS